MKIYFTVGVGFLLILLVGLILYGMWLNNQGEVRIIQRMSEQKCSLPSALVERRTLYLRIVFNAINLYSNDMTDAVALIDGRITESFAPKNTRVKQGEVIVANVYDRQKRLLDRKATSVAKFQEA